MPVTTPGLRDRREHAAARRALAVLDTIRTMLFVLVAEMRAVGVEEVPTSEAAVGSSGIITAVVGVAVWVGWNPFN